ncbi:hypothetical protein SI65_01122 [Aspergillus cristatus]|uniref:Uncharacterized protein n=1 Tax=Aspergillus cristatus TaxID=573508 RepID=A0A1E3BRD1_ASPCR|nr:hypothetical protein SI65_01122 [Aspergillus cristatus]
MGRCRYIDVDGDMCLCDAGNTISSLGEDWLASVCTNCPHMMRPHNNFIPSEPNVESPKKNRPPALRKQNFPISSLYTPRLSLVGGIIAAARQNYIIQVCGTPASGKTILSRLIANELFRRNEQVFYIDGWKDAVEKAGGWNEYLKSQTGVEAQQSYRDEDLFSGFFKSIEVFDKNSPCVILFVSYGSAGHALEESQGKGHFQTPMQFPPAQIIGFDINPYGLSLLLSQDEGNDIVRKYMENNDVDFQDELVSEMLRMSAGHTGGLVCLLGAVARCGDITKWRNQNPEHPIPLKVVREVLFDDQTSFFRQIYNTAFCRGLPPPDILQKLECAKLLKKAVANDGINTKEMSFDENQRLELNYIWKKGWLSNNNEGLYCFPSSIRI